MQQGTISKIEQDLMSISGELLSGLSKSLGYPESFFFEKALLFAPGLSLHRKRSALPKKALNRIDAVVNIQRIHLQKLLLSVDIPENNIPFYEVEEFGSPERIAQMVRQAWYVPAGPVDNVTKLIEDAGGVIYSCRFDTHLIDGLSSSNLQRLPPTIFVNSNLLGDRLRFTLAHELGHLVMHRFPTEHMEEEANQFASEFLMPASDIRHQLSYMTLQKLAGLKPFWKVSMGALLTRTASLEQITPRQAQYLWMQISKAGYRLREPAELDIPIEKPSLVRELIDIHIEDLGYSPQEVIDMLSLSRQDFTDYYLDRRLRLVH
ncbi:MAG: hypothetical protein A2075_21730 [Geobacteraceae bacterium GWC2_58_44]|nr:MAG: hypothetical protein A2075_21730 [Geobacteraceae bacterium GWC2_58_44]